MKHQGFELIVIRLRLAGNRDKLEMLEGLALPPGGNGDIYIYNANSAPDPAGAFQEIASRLTNIRLSM